MQHNTFNIQYSLLLDMVLNDIRNATISYKVGKNRTEDSKIKKVQSLIIEAESELNMDPTNINVLTKIERLQNEYSDLLEGKKSSKIFASKLFAKINGEKPTADFCALEKNFSAQKYICT